MAEIPSWMWMLSGVVVTGFSVFMGFIRPVETGAAFFRFMVFVGIAMFGFGFLKMKLSSKTKESMIDEMRRRQMQRGPGEVEIGQRAMNTGYPQQNYQYGQQQAQTNSPYQQHQNQPVHATHHTHNVQHHTPVQHHPSHVNHQQSQSRPSVQTQSRFCHQCGTPLLKHHKYCPICGAKV